MNFPKQPGTYCFHNTVNNKVYVGSAKCLYTRISEHFNNRNSNKLLQDSITKRGLKAYNITYVITKTHAEALMQEQLILDYLFQNNVPKYNLSPNAVGGSGLTAKVIYALEINKPNFVHTFKSIIKSFEYTSVNIGQISLSCKKAKPYNGLGRWLFSDVSIDDLKVKFNNLTQYEITGNNNQKFILINKNTGVESQIFNSAYEPSKKGYLINRGNLSSCLLGNRKSTSGYRVALCI